MSGKSEELNVIFFSPDTVRRDHLSCYGYHRKTTPNLDRLAKEGVLFTDHVANSGWTLPQYMTMHTGLYPLTHRMTLLRHNPPLSSKIFTIAEILKKHGYVTKAFTSSNRYLHPSLGYGRGFDDYFWGFGYNQATKRIVNEAIKWLDEHGRQNKFFIFIHDNDTHEPFNPPKPFDDMWGEGYIDRYDGEISHVDYYFGMLLDKLEELGIKENTLVIYTSDHGTEFWEHGFLEKKVNLYNEILHVPLVMSCPSVLPEGKTIHGLIATVDIVPTILDILNIPVTYTLQGKSYLPLIKGDPDFQPRNMVFSHTEHNTRLRNVDQPSFEHLSVHTGDYKFIRAKILLPFDERFFEIKMEGGGNWVTRFKALAKRIGMDPSKIRQGTIFRELYDLRNDPKEQRNIIDEKWEIAVELEKKLDLWVEETRKLGNELASAIPKAEKPEKILTRQRLARGQIIPKCPIPIRINVGGDDYIDSAGCKWLADRPYSYGKWGYVTRTYSDVLIVRSKIWNTDDPTIYQSQRFGQSFSYIFNVPNGEYKVILHFAETIMDFGGIEFFNVYIQDKPVLMSFNIFNEAGGKCRAIKKTFTCKVNDNQLSIYFESLTEPQQEAAKVAGIEVLPMGQNKKSASTGSPKL